MPICPGLCTLPQKLEEHKCSFTGVSLQLTFVPESDFIADS